MGKENPIWSTLHVWIYHGTDNPVMEWIENYLFMPGIEYSWSYWPIYIKVRKGSTHRIYERKTCKDEEKNRKTVNEGQIERSNMDARFQRSRGYSQNGDQINGQVTQTEISNERQGEYRQLILSNTWRVRQSEYPRNIFAVQNWRWKFICSFHALFF